MSFLIKIDSIPLEKRKNIILDLNIKNIVKKGKEKYSSTETFELYEIIDDEYVSVPFSYYYQHFNDFPNSDKNFEKMTATFNIPLFDRQQEIKKETLSILNETRSIVLSLFTGFGKTTYSIYLACKIGLKTLIYCHRIILIDQWRQSIIKACGEDVKIQIVNSTNSIDKDADFYIINVSNITKRNINDFSHCGLLIADECHTLCTDKFSKSFGYIFPKYCIGLTATPVRSDGKDRVIELVFGPHIIYKPLQSMFNVYLYYTNFMPKVETNDNGEMLWNSVLESQCNDIKRNEILIDVIRYFCHRNILVLCKRKDHALALKNTLLKYGEDVDVYMGSQKIMNYDCRVLIATYSKGGVGMDHPKLDMLLVAADAEENWIQYLGRVFRKEYQFPIVVDFMDKFRPLKKHTDTRIKIYKESGGDVKNLLNHFPDFEEWRKIFKTTVTKDN